MKHITFQTSGTCSRQIDIDIDDEGRIQNVSFIGGCNGNLQVEDVMSKLEGIRCGYKNTSCPDQLAQALKQYES